MNIDASLILDNIASPLVLAKPLKDNDGTITDFEIVYTNKAIDKYIPEQAQTITLWSEYLAFDPDFSICYEEAVEVYNGKQTTPFIYSSSKVNDCWFKTMITKASDDLIIITFANITEEHQFAQDLKESIFNDPLTDLPNRACFIDNFSYELLKNQNNNTVMGLLILDIDDLMSINESKGSETGDHVIKETASILQRFQRDNIKIYRYGGDEFAVIMTGLPGTNSVITITDTIYEIFQNTDISLSGGISIYPEHSHNSEELIRFADMGVHYSKKNGKNQFTCFNTGLQRDFIQKITLQSKLSMAYIENKLKLYYQPQFEVLTGELRGFEALLRWNDADLGDIPPSVFIPVAEEMGMIIPIGKYAMQTALKTLKKWQIYFNFDGIISINVSPIQLKQDDFLDDFINCIEEYNINPASIEIEITEGVMINNMFSVIQKLRVIKEMGIKISLDDFGTGYSSLNYLQMLPLDTLKIDKSFINNICENDGVQANITSSIIKMVSKMGLETIAEGVEAENQLDVLRDLHCTIVQGFLRGKPMPEDFCDRYLAGDSTALLRN